MENNCNKNDAIDRDMRNFSIELLRIISMIGVMVLHYNNDDIGGGFKYVKDGTVNQLYLYFTENFFVCAVNLFIIISAYFLATTNQRKIIKIVELIIQVIIFNFMFYFFDIIGGINIFSVKGTLGCLLPLNYFVILYSVMYIVSPYINLLMDKLEDKQLKRLIITLILLFSFCTYFVDFLENIINIPLMGLSTVGLYGSQDGYSIVNFLLIYFIGAYIRKKNVRISSRNAICGIVLVLIITYIQSISEHMLGLKCISTWKYNNPLVILTASLILLLSLNYKFSNKYINWLAKCAFTCFLIHGKILPYFNIHTIVNKNILILIFHQFGISILLYLFSYIVYKIYCLCSNRFIKLLTSICNKINISL